MRASRRVVTDANAAAPSETPDQCTTPEQTLGPWRSRRSGGVPMSMRLQRVAR